MNCEELIAAAQEALGGLERIRGIRTYHAVMRRVTDAGAAATVSIWRAAGGKVRIERRAGGSTDVRVANGATGTIGEDERAEMLRDARLSPRNMLAHAAEYRLTLRSRPAPDGSRLVSFPAEMALYLFDPRTFLCRKLIDLPRRCRVEYEDYRVVDGIPTPFSERRVSNATSGFRDTYSYVAYNMELDEALFDVRR